MKGYRKQQQLATDRIKTSGAAYAITATLQKDNSKIRTGLAQVVVQVVDEAGNPVYQAENEISVAIQGKATLLGLESGSSSSHEDYKAGERRVVHGKMLAYIRLPAGSEGVRVTFSTPGLKNKIKLLILTTYGLQEGIVTSPGLTSAAGGTMERSGILWN